MVNCFKMTLTRATKFCVAVTILGLLGTFTLMFFSCPPNILPPMESSERFGYVYILPNEKDTKSGVHFC